MGILARRSWFVIAPLIAFAAGDVHASGTPDCPDLAGHYRVDGFGPVLGDALKALGLGMAGFQDSEVKITGDAATSLGFWIKSGKTSPMSSRPVVALTRGVDYDCAGSSIMLKHKVQASRQTSEGWLEGQSSVHLSRSGRGLGIGTGFHGRQRTTLYSYDSARISIPKLGTAQSLGDGIRWPHISEPRPASETWVETPESTQVLAIRKTLNTSLLGGVNIGGLHDSGARVLANLNARNSDEVIAFENRLRDAEIAYEVKRQPIWSNNGYSMQFLFGVDGAAQQGWHPSGFRVQHEIERIQHPMVSVREVDDLGDHYVATLDVIGSESSDAILKRLRMNSQMFDEITVLDDAPDHRAKNLHALRLRVTIR